MKILSEDIYDPSVDWTEDHHQLVITQLLRQIEKAGSITFAADMNAGKRSRGHGSKLKALGMRAGEPDIRVYARGGALISFEIKKFKGAASKSQRDRIDLLHQLGFPVYIIRERTPGEARDLVATILELHGVKSIPQTAA